jgi:hypothetical protein
MGQLWNRMFKDCEHPHTLVITSVGVRRTVCERCGHMSFDMRDKLSQVTSIPPQQPDPELPKVAGL